MILAPDLSTFGARLAALRHARGTLNIAAAARRCGLNPQTWRNWEAGTQPHDYEAACRRIASSLGAPLDWLMRGETTDGWADTG